MALTLSLEEAAELIGGATPSQVASLIRQGKIKSLKIGKSHRVTYEAVQEFVEAQQATPKKHYYKTAQAKENAQNRGHKMLEAKAAKRLLESV